MQSPRLVAVDTNFLLSLAARDENTVDALELIRLRLKPVFVLAPPTVLDEAGHKAMDPAGGEIAALASKALVELRHHWHLQPAELRSDQEALVEQAATAVRDAGLIPWQERNDAYVLAEASVLRCLLLVSEDSHLLDVDHHKLGRLFKRFDLEAPAIESPRRLIKQFSH